MFFNKRNYADFRDAAYEMVSRSRGQSLEIATLEGTAFLAQNFGAK
jgi:hypothetical protein